MKNISKCKMAYYLLTGVIGILFFGVIGKEGAILTNDSSFFLGMHGKGATGYIIYPAFVRFFVFIFGENHGLILIWLIQSVLAYSVSLYMSEWLRNRFELSYLLTMVCFLLSLLPYGYTLPEYVATHEIMTEGIAISIFNMLFILLLRWSLDRENKILWHVFFLLFLLILTRPQLLTILVAAIYVCISEVFNGFIQKKDAVKRRVAYVLLGAMCVVMLFSMRPIMKYAMKIMPQFSHAVSGKVLLTIKNDDRDYFTDIEQEAFDYVYGKINEKKSHIDYMAKDVFSADEVMIAVNDNTKFYISYFHEFCVGKENELQINLSQTDIRDNIINTLFIENFDRYIKLVCQLLPYSFVASIFIQPHSIKVLCYMATAILYLFSCLIFLNTKRKNIDCKYTKPYRSTMSILVINVLLTNMAFYAQQRYVVYTFGWFYITVLIMIIGIHRKYIFYNKSINNIER